MWSFSIMRCDSKGRQGDCLPSSVGSTLGLIEMGGRKEVLGKAIVSWVGSLSCKKMRSEEKKKVSSPQKLL